MKKREIFAPVLFAIVAFVYCVISLVSVKYGWNFPVSNSENHFVNMVILAFIAVLITAYPYQLLKPDNREVWTYAQAKSAVFGYCALPFLWMMVYIYHTYGENWRPQSVQNVWDFCFAYVACCWGFMLFLLTTAYNLKQKN